MRLPFVDATRRNHALEHATIAILLSRLGGSPRLVGRSTPSGFYIYGSLETRDIEAAAHEALRRLQRGEAELAVSPLCGTNIAIAGILTGLSSVIAVGKDRRSDRFANVFVAATAALIAAQPLGRLVQKYVTTSPELAGVSITRITCQLLGGLKIHKVETTQAAATPPLSGRQ